MAARERIGRIALLSLVAALALVILGKVIESRDGMIIIGGLIAAFGEAALVGGLADWFAVRALFAHPLGFPLPHTALIPRNRKRLTAEVRNLVLNEWLPRELLADKIRSFDFVGRGILPALPQLRPQLRKMIRLSLREALSRAEPERITAWAMQGVSGDARHIAGWLAELIRHTRAKDWLEPVLRGLVARMEQWADTPAFRRLIQQRMEGAAQSYRQGGGWKDFMLTLGEISGGVDFAQASATVQTEMRNFAAEQLAQGSQLRNFLRDSLTDLEHRLRDDPETHAALRGAMADSDAVLGVLSRVLATLRDEAIARLDAEDSPWLDLAVREADAWLTRLGEDQTLRTRVNEWCRNFLVAQLEQHHAIIGELVEQQMNRLSDDSLTELIQKRVGEDLNWIRLNGTFVGGLIGVAIYLGTMLVRWVF